MSLLVVADNYLIADRKCICQLEGYTNIQYSQKIRVSKCERFAYGSVGLLFPEKEIDTVEEMLLEKITTLSNRSEPSERLKNFIKTSCVKEDRYIVLMTREATLALTPTGDVYINRLHGYGTGATYFMAAYKLTGDIFKAYYQTEENVPTVGMENCEQPDVIDQNKLKSILIVDGKIFSNLTPEILEEMKQ